LPAGRLELEITESVLLEGVDSNLSTLNKLRALGLRIALDDFGTGYSSLSYLQSFPFDKIKIDHSFIRNIAVQNDSIKIVRAIVMLARSLGMTTTAEGVETQEQLDIVRVEGCDEVQGYLISRPEPAQVVSKLLVAKPEERAANLAPQARKAG
jgi:EAL domain-containing protein (putative c-di-GMP-specific phosphodiesterase class I)